MGDFLLRHGLKVVVVALLVLVIGLAEIGWAMHSYSHPPPEPDPDCERQAWIEMHHCIDESDDRKGECLRGGAMLLQACSE